jgi:VIT1/CCC1 family predicted Fe2+/Mn2+ transporter
LLTAGGGLLPIIPYFTTSDVTHALLISLGITVAILLLFGFYKNYSMVRKKRSGFNGAIQTFSVGVIAAGASYGTVYASIAPTLDKS